MSNYRINVIVDPSNAVGGLNRIDRQINTVARDADNLRSILERAFAFATLGYGIQQIVQLADAFTEMQNKIRVVTSSTAQLNVVTEELFRIANSTRTAIESTTALYSRLALAAKDLGISQKQTLQFTESLNQAVVVSGASAIEANNAIIQLSQGLASGTLRGDELRSVLEQLPYAADIIAKQLGVTRGELRKMGEDGKITAQQVVAAFANAREEIAEKFAKTVPTVGQAFTVLNNTFMQTLGTLDQATGASANLAKGILFLAENLETIGRVALAAGIAFGTYFAAQGVDVAAQALARLSLMILANPLGALAVAAGAAVAAMVAFSDQIAATEDGVVNLQDFAEGAFDVISEKVLDATADVRKALDDALVRAGVFAEGTELSFEKVARAVAWLVDRVLGHFIGLFNAIKTVYTALPEVFDRVFTDALNKVVSGVEYAINAVIEGVNTLREKVNLDPFEKVNFGRFQTEAKKGFEDVGQAAMDAYLTGFNQTRITDMLNEIYDKSREIAEKRIADEKAAAEAAAKAREELAKEGVDRTKQAETVDKAAQEFAVLLQRYDNEIALLKLSTREREIQRAVFEAEIMMKRKLTATEEEALRSRAETLQSLRDQVQVYEYAKGPIEEYTRTLEAANVLLKEGKLSLDEYRAALEQTQLGSSLRQLSIDLAPTDQDAELMRLQDEQSQRLLLVQQALEARVLLEEEAAERIEAIHRDYNQRVQDIETARMSIGLQSASSTFGSLAQMTAQFAGKQSGIYRTMFAASKAFAIADSAVQIANGIAKAANNPFPANLAAMAAVAAQTASVISNIRSIQYGGEFQNGGDFKVGGAGGTDSQMVAFKASPGETVSVRTPMQQKSEDNAQTDGGGGRGLRLVNVVDGSLLRDYLTSSDGEEVLVNFLTSNGGLVQQLSQGG